MTEVAIGLIVEALLRSALEAHAIRRQMDVEGRTHTTAEENAKIQAATDSAAAAARAEGQDL